MSTIQIRGARENNLTGVNVDLPRGALIALTGPSGSGKSSLAIDTLHAEGQRRLVEALGAGRSYRLRRPDADLITGLPPTIGVLQHATRSRRSTLGSLTEVAPLLRTLAAHTGIAHCPHCDAPLQVRSPEQITAALCQRSAGSRLTILAPIRYSSSPGRLLDEIHQQGFARIRINGILYRLDDTPALRPDAHPTIEVVVDRIKVQPEKRARIFEAIQAALAAGDGRVMIQTLPDEPLLQFAAHPYCFTHDLSLPTVTPQRLSPNVPEGCCEECDGLGCDSCHGTGLSDTAQRLRLAGRTLLDWLTTEARSIAAWLTELPVQPGAAPLREELRRRIDLLLQLGLGHLPLGRKATDLSTGEHCRARLIGQTGHELSGVLFIIDEPSTGLHPADLPKVVAYLRHLRDAGNTVLVVDHHPAVLAAAGHHVRLGPGAGPAGGTLLHSGLPQLGMPSPLPRCQPGPAAEPAIVLSGAQGRNLKHVTLCVPRGAWTAVCGVSGSGKSALVSDTLAPAIRQHLRQKASPLPFEAISGLDGIKRLLLLDRVPMGRTWRSCTATALGVWSNIRTLLSTTRTARIRGFGPERFSFNRTGGRCEACQGAGRQRLSLDYLPDAVVRCAVCEGRRFDEATLSVQYKGASVHDILQMRVSEARQLFVNQPRILRILTALSDVGLGYLALGQTADTFSGGEAQRIRLASELARTGARSPLSDTVIVLDEPAAALHADDVIPVRDALRRLVSRGATLVTVATAPALLHAADHLVVMGPAAGPDGGTVVEQGRPG